MQLDRRTFLSATAASLWAPSLPAAAPPAPRARKIKRAVKLYMVEGNEPLADKMRRVKDLGFDGIELDSPNQFAPGEVVKAIAAAGLPVHGVVDSVHWNKPLSHADASVREEGRKALVTALHDAKEYGASSVLLVPAVVNAKTSYEAAFTRSQEEIARVLDVATKLDITIAFENVWNNFLLSPLEFKSYVDHFKSPHVKAYFDVGNVVKYGWPAHWIEALGKERILKVDIKEYSHKKGFAPDLFDGDCNWPAVMAAFDAIGYEGWFTAEMKGGDQAWLANVATKMSKIIAL
jgi:hexulose-6-phosphate isomerase